MEQTALIPGFANDIFISYAGVNNSDYRQHPDRDDGPGWVDLFLKELQAKLYGSGKWAKVWYDKTGIIRGQTWSPLIKTGACSSALFVALVSRAYLKRPICREEVSHFFSQGEGLYPFVVGSHCRVFIVALEDLSPIIEEVTTLMRPVESDPRRYARLQHDFYELQNGTSYRLTSYDRTADTYGRKLTELVRALDEALEAMLRRAPPPESVMANTYLRHNSEHCAYAGHAQAPFRTAPQSYLAGAASLSSGSTAVDLRQRVISQLDQRDIDVLNPEMAGMITEENAARVIQSGLRRTTLLIQVVDIDEANSFSQQHFSYLQTLWQQAALRATDRSQRPFWRIFWMSERTKAAVVNMPREQQLFMDTMQNSQSAADKLIVLAGDDREFLAAVNEVLGFTRAPWQRPTKALSVYIAHQEKNALHAKRIKQKLKGLKIEDVQSPPFPNTDPTDRRLLTMHRSKILSSDGLVVIFSGDDRVEDILFLHRRNIDLVKDLKTKKGASLNLKGKLIYEAPPPPIRNVDPGVDANDWPVVPDGDEESFIELRSRMIGEP